MPTGTAHAGPRDPTCSHSATVLSSPAEPWPAQMSRSAATEPPPPGGGHQPTRAKPGARDGALEAADGNGEAPPALCKTRTGSGLGDAREA